MITATMPGVASLHAARAAGPWGDMQRRIVKAGSDPAMDRRRFITLAREVIAAERRRWRDRPVAGSRGRGGQGWQGWRYARRNSALADILLRGAFTLAGGGEGDREVSVAALGGYGRGELCPFSDLDILFLIDRKTPGVETLIENLLYILWDIGLNPGHSVRRIEECLSDARKDWNLRTSFLDLRYLAGSRRGFNVLKHRIHARLVAGFEQDITDEKWREMDQRHAVMGDSRYLLEPNVKEGKGGLRDLHTVWWIARAHGRIATPMDLKRQGILDAVEVTTLLRSLRFFLSIRCHLHLAWDRPEERLSFDSQKIVAAAMGWGGDRGQRRLMREYFLITRHVGHIVHIFRNLFPARRSRLDPRRWPARIGLPARPLHRPRVIDGMRIAHGKVALIEADIADHPWRILDVFRVAQKETLKLHHETRRVLRRQRSRINAALRRDPRANRAFLSILTGDNAYGILSQMNDTGVLGRFIPAFGRIIGSIQQDLYHAYTIDEHTLRVIDHLQRIESGAWLDAHPLASMAIGKVERRALYAAAFLHDLGKGRKSDHSLAGARIAARVCPRLGLDPSQTDTAVWLVRHHLLMSHTAFRRDLDDPKTLDDFITAVQSLERLRLLLILTVADIRAVSPTTWTTWKKDLLTQLYGAAEDVLTGRRDLRSGKNPDQARAALRAAVGTRFRRRDVTGFEALASNRFWLSEPVRTQEQCAGLVIEAEKTMTPLRASTRGGPARRFATSLLKGGAAGDGGIELAVYADSYPRLFSDIAGALTLAGGDIAQGRAYRMGNGRTLAVFLVQSSRHWWSGSRPVPFAEEERPARFHSFLERAVEGRLDLETRLKRRGSTLPDRALGVPSQVHIYNHLSRTWSVIEAVGRDRPGLLFALTRTLADQGLRIASARIVSHGVRVVDAFYVRDAFGLKIESPRKMSALRQALIDVIGPDAPSTRPRRPGR